jgi:hypothetical protein
VRGSPGAASPWRAAAGPLLRALIVRPWLWPPAVVAAVRLARRGWWRRWPPVPLPDPDYWRFRMVTAYGGEGDRPPTVEDVVAYLEWCRRRR